MVGGPIVLDASEVFVDYCNDRWSVPIDSLSHVSHAAAGLDEQGDVVWVAEDLRLKEQPAASMLQRIEDWFFSHLPLEDEL
ncbi:MAG TPA: hypothetical protein VLS87_03705 [Woeseiaceae bacterium]|nr:hypothetical protein [Woeseiaceae bacterium]